MADTWLTTEHPAIVFEDNSVGQLKKKIWDASEKEIDAILKEYGVPAPSELGTAGCYIQNTPRVKVIEKRRKNDVVFVPIGLGSGILLGESGRHEALRKLVCVEIARDVVKGARYFSEENYGILNDPRATIVVDDVADFLQGTKEKYDIISADEKTAGKYASNAFSYSTDYYKLLKERLARDGLVIQWVPTD